MLTPSHREGQPAPSAVSKDPGEARLTPVRPSKLGEGREKKHTSGTRGGLLVPGERCTSSYKPAAVAGRRGQNGPQDGLVETRAAQAEEQSGMGCWGQRSFFSRSGGQNRNGRKAR